MRQRRSTQKNSPHYFFSPSRRLGIDVISCTYLVVLCCFLLDMLLFVTFSNIIGMYIKDIAKSYSYLMKLVKRNVFYVLLPVGKNFYSKFSFFLGINISIIFLTFMLLSASKRIEILFLSFDDIYFFKPKNTWLDVRWVLLFLLYYLYSSLDITFLDLFFTEISHIITLLILFYINFNFFWIRGFKKTMEKFGKCPLICQLVLTALNQFFFFYFEIIFRLPNRVTLYLVRQVINICIIPLVSVLLFRCAWFGGPMQLRRGGIKQILVSHTLCARSASCANSAFPYATVTSSSCTFPYFRPFQPLRHLPHLFPFRWTPMSSPPSAPTSPRTSSSSSARHPRVPSGSTSTSSFSANTWGSTWCLCALYMWEVAFFQ